MAGLMNFFKKKSVLNKNSRNRGDFCRKVRKFSKINK